MRAFMAKYVLLIKVYLKSYRQYPIRLFLKLVYLPVQMMMYLFLWTNLRKSNPIDIHYMGNYYLIVGLLTNAYPFRHIALHIQDDVMEGSIANSLVRPYPYIVPAFCKYVAWSLLYSVVFIPTLVYIGVSRGVTFAQVLYFVVAVMIGKLIEFFLWFDIGLVALFMERISGIMTMMNAVMIFVSGSIIPLSFYPDWCERITYLFPFRFYVYFPTDLLLDEKEVPYVWVHFLIGIAWIMFLWFLSKKVWEKGIYKLRGNMS